MKALPKVPFGRCMVCHRPIEEIGIYRDLYTHQLHITARCHGSEETKKLSFHQEISSEWPRYWFLGEAERRNMGAAIRLEEARDKNRRPAVSLFF